MTIDEIMLLVDQYAYLQEAVAQTTDAIVPRNHARAAVVAALRDLAKDAERGRFMVENGCWHRGEEQTHLAVLVPQGYDLSCLATRRAAIDAAMEVTP